MTNPADIPPPLPWDQRAPGVDAMPGGIQATSIHFVKSVNMSSANALHLQTWPTGFGGSLNSVVEAPKLEWLFCGKQGFLSQLPTNFV